MCTVNFTQQKNQDCINGLKQKTRKMHRNVVEYITKKSDKKRHFDCNSIVINALNKSGNSPKSSDEWMVTKIQLSPLVIKS